LTKPSSHIYLGLLCLMIVLSGCRQQAQPTPNKPQFKPESTAVQQTLAAPVYQRNETITSPEPALQLLLEGNERFKSGNIMNKDLSTAKRYNLLKKGQHPFAVVLSCSDSRVPPEILFDQALGDLFVIRVAGNVVTPVELGSVEYAVEHLKVPLVMVLGHEACGAVTAAAEGGETPGSISSIVDKINPSINEAKSTGLNGTALIEKSVDLNVENSLQEISKSPIIKKYIDMKCLQTIGAKYDLDDGKVQLIQ
jgi:carbonic anhydrase